MARIPQYPTPPNEWLHDGALDYTRIFTDYILRDESAPLWAECTTEEKEQWEREHPQPEPPQLEPENAGNGGNNGGNNPDDGMLG